MPRGISESAIPGLRLQERDLESLQILGELGLLDTETYHRRFFPKDQTGQACRRRLRLFAQHGITQTIQLSVTSTQRRGRLPTLHRLTVYGADLLEQVTGCRPLRYARTDPPRQALTLMHRLGIAKLQLAMNDSCCGAGIMQPEWILEYDPQPNATVNSPMSQRFILCHQFPQSNGKTLSCWPDAASMLTIPQREKQWRLAVFWEYDRSTETHAQLNGSKTSHSGNGKMDGYEALLGAKAYLQHWRDVQGVRVFFVVPSERRLQNIIKTFKGKPAAEYVRLAVEKDVTPETALTAPIWRTMNGEKRPILSSSHGS